MTVLLETVIIFVSSEGITTMAMNVNTGVFVVDAGMTGLLDDFDVLFLNIADECSLNLREKLKVMESAKEREMLAMPGSCVASQRCA